MKEKKLLIAGIDPGMTTAYAVLDIEGNLIRVDSSKQFNLNSMISEIIRLGKVVLVGTDKAKVPRLVEDFAIKTGARVISPTEDLRVDEKRKMTYNLKFEDNHQSDALASALFAYRSAKSLLDKIDAFAVNNRKQNIKNRIKELVITKRVSIRSSVGIIEKKDGESVIMEKVVEEKKLDENDFLKLYSKLKAYENELKLMRIHNDNMKNRIKNLENIPKQVVHQTREETRDFREKRIFSLENAVKSREAETEKLKSIIKKLNRIISSANNYYILKKLDNFGIKEFNYKNKVLNIKKNDILLVGDPNIISQQVIDTIKNDVFVVICKKPISSKIENILPFVLMSAENLEIDEDGYFGFIERKHFEVEKSKVDWARRIINEYRKERLIPR